MALRWHWIHYLNTAFLGFRWYYWIYLIYKTNGDLEDYETIHDPVMRVVCLRILNKNSLLIYSLAPLVLFSIHLEVFIHHKFYPLFQRFFDDLLNLSKIFQHSELSVRSLMKYKDEDIHQGVVSLLDRINIHDQMFFNMKDKILFFYIFVLNEFIFHIQTVTIREFI